MRSPKDMGIIEIDITNACVHACANCTRFCGHHKKPFYMDFETFKKAVDSLKDYKGMIGIIGGEPTIHPEFERFVDYVRENRVGKSLTLARGPIEDMQFHILTTVDAGKSRTVLLSTLSKGYYKNFEVINDTFAYQLLNDHSSESEHQALRMNRKELGIPDDEWKKKRDACWIQNTWSATITPKGAFFCEVAGALDILFDGPGGWKIEDGWYNREPKDFADQLHWCELCSACLDAPKRLSHDERDDVTPGMFEKLKDIGSPKALNDRCVVRDPAKYEEYKSETYVTGSEYIEAGKFIRTSKENRNLYPKDVLVTSRESVWKDIDEKKPKDWVLICDENSDVESMVKYVLDRIWNTGCVYEINGKYTLFNVIGRSVRDAVKAGAGTECIEEYYPDDKHVIVSTDDPLLFLLGGDMVSDLKYGSHIGKHLLIYGAGRIGERVIKYVLDKGYTDFDVVVTDKNKTKNAVVCGYEVKELKDFVDRKDDVVVAVTTRGYFHEEMLDTIKELGFTCYRFVA